MSELKKHNHQPKTTIHISNISGSMAGLLEYCEGLKGFQRISFHQDFLFACFRSLSDASEAIATINTDTAMVASYAKNGVMANPAPSILVKPNSILYVSLTQHISPTDLAAIFRSHRGFDSCRFFPSHALVRFSNVADASEALRRLNASTNLSINFSTRGGSSANGLEDKENSKVPTNFPLSSLIEVSAESKPLLPSSSSQYFAAKKTIHVTSIDVSKAELLATFKAFPGFIRIAFYPDYCFACFSDNVSASHAIEEILFKTNMKANFAKTDFTPHASLLAMQSSASSDGPSATGIPNSILRISDFPSNTTNPELLQLFKPYSGFTSIHYYQASCLVYFSSISTASAALADINTFTNMVAIYSKKNVCVSNPMSISLSTIRKYPVPAKIAKSDSNNVEEASLPDVCIKDESAAVPTAETPDTQTTEELVAKTGSQSNTNIPTPYTRVNALLPRQLKSSVAESTDPQTKLEPSSNIASGILAEISRRHSRSSSVCSSSSISTSNALPPAAPQCASYPFTTPSIASVCSNSASGSCSDASSTSKSNGINKASPVSDHVPQRNASVPSLLPSYDKQSSKQNQQLAQSASNIPHSYASLSRYETRPLSLGSTTNTGSKYTFESRLEGMGSLPVSSSNNKAIYSATTGSASLYASSATSCSSSPKIENTPTKQPSNTTIPDTKAMPNTLDPIFVGNPNYGPFNNQRVIWRSPWSSVSSFGASTLFFGENDVLDQPEVSLKPSSSTLDDIDNQYTIEDYLNHKNDALPSLAQISLSSGLLRRPTESVCASTQYECSNETEAENVSCTTHTGSPHQQPRELILNKTCEYPGSPHECVWKRKYEDVCERHARLVEEYQALRDELLKRDSDAERYDVIQGILNICEQ